MKHKRSIVVCCALIVLVVAASSCAKKGDEDPTSAAVKAAEKWLEVVDKGEYGASWDQSSELFKGAITTEGWDQALGVARKPLGKLVSRNVKSTQFATTLPNAPEGEYVVIEFATDFANKSGAIETVTPMKEADGTWRVSGYYVR